MLLHTLPVASAQAPISPPDYTLICDPTNTQIEVDPNTPKPPEGSVECTVQNQESYAIELSIETELELVETQHVNSIEIQGNSEETFEVSLKAEDEMLMMNLLLELETKVTKTGGFDYSDDESLNYRFLVNILQYGEFSIEAHQSNEDVELIDGEELQLSYTITNTGNGMDIILFNSRSYATPVCDETKRQEINDGGTLCELSTPVSDDCDEELVAKDADDPKANVHVNWMLDVDESFTRTLSFAGNIENTSCWPTDSNGDYNLVFTQQTRVISDSQRGYFSSSQGFTGNNNWTTIETNIDVTMNNGRGIINSVVPGFEAILTLIAMCVAFVRRPVEQYSQTK
tara:strand:- start:148 stop:1176 length:1029 start_codon:yes stop_codon:yes gene_type:complete